MSRISLLSFTVLTAVLFISRCGQRLSYLMRLAYQSPLYVEILCGSLQVASFWALIRSAEFPRDAGLVSGEVSWRGYAVDLAADTGATLFS